MELKAKDIMTSDVYSVSPVMPIVDMDAELLRRGISGAPVMQENRLLGVVSRSDIGKKLSGDIEEDDYMWSSEESLMSAMVGTTRNVKSAVENIRELCVQDIMSDKAVNVAPEDSIQNVATLMVSKKIHRVLVTEGDQLRGIISSMDLMKILADS